LLKIKGKKKKYIENERESRIKKRSKKKRIGEESKKWKLWHDLLEPMLSARLTLIIVSFYVQFVNFTKAKIYINITLLRYMLYII